MIMPSTVLLLGLTIAVSIDAYLGRKQRKMMFTVIVMVFLLILQNYTEYCLVVGRHGCVCEPTWQSWVIASAP